MANPGGGSLPPEIINAVLRYLLPIESITFYESTGDTTSIHPSYKESRSSLASLCLVSKMFRNIATEILYQTALLDSKERLLCFFRTLLEAPSYQKYVRNLIWTGQISIEDEVNIKRTEPLHLTLNSEIEVHCISDDQITALTSLFNFESITHPTSSILAAVLYLSFRVRTLFLSIHPGLPPERTPGGLFRITSTPEQKALRTLFVRSTDQDPNQRTPLQTLETIILEPSYDHYVRTLNLAGVLSLHILPKLRHIILKGSPSFDCIVKARRQQPTVLQKIHTLYQVGHPFVRRDMALLVKAFPELITLHSEHRDEDSYSEVSSSSSNSDVTAFFNDPRDQEFLDNLHKLNTTLRSLSLSTVLGQSWSMRNTWGLRPRGLAQMEFLQHLRIDMIWLLGRIHVPSGNDVAALFPSSLVTVHLIDYWGETDLDTYWPPFEGDITSVQFFENILHSLHCSADLINLRSITVSSSNFDQSLLSESGIELVSAFTETKINLIFTSLDDSRATISSAWARTYIED
ncbi:hypothetical protein BX600DRAFT_55533 [Xylariales sp. PMI_506]|nr:hypothetical protein BX600DRAFT_55533 [Xylariales sp. PMI_506]